jgi:hypothetical protein
MIHPQEFLDDWEVLLAEGEVMDDDIIRGPSPIQSVFWIEGMLGSRMIVQPGNVQVVGRELPVEELKKVTLDRDSPWFKKYIEFIEALVTRARGRYPVSHGALTGPLDSVAALHGTEQTVVDLMLEPDSMAPVVEQFGRIFRQITDAAWDRIPRFHGGYFDSQYSLWAPSAIARLQEDAMAVISPSLYTKYIRPVDRMVAQGYESAFMHLHSTAMFLLDELLSIDEIKCFQINLDDGGPSLEWMLPYYQKTQKAKKPLLVRGSFSPDDLRLIMDSLEPEGLFLYVMVSDMREVEILRPLVGL